MTFPVALQEDGAREYGRRSDKPISTLDTKALSFPVVTENRASFHSVNIQDDRNYGQLAKTANHAGLLR